MPKKKNCSDDISRILVKFSARVHLYSMRCTRLPDATSTRYKPWCHGIGQWCPVAQSGMLLGDAGAAPQCWPRNP